MTLKFSANDWKCCVCIHRIFCESNGQKNTASPQQNWESTYFFKSHTEFFNIQFIYFMLSSGKHIVKNEINHHHLIIVTIIMI